MRSPRAFPAIAVLAAGAAAAQVHVPKFEPQGFGFEVGGALKWVLLLAALGGLGHLTYWLVTTRLRQRRRRGTAVAKRVQVAQGFEDRASTLGFRHGEARTVERIALRLAPKSPTSLLTTASGREYLIGDVDRRIGQRQREIKVLERIKERLVVLRAQDVHERGSVRIEANISVWVSKRGLLRGEVAALVDDEDEAEAEGADQFGKLDSVMGRLLDISEGGAAIEVDLPEVDKGDQVEFWSADPHVVLGETRGGVLSRETRGGSPVLHLHFVDPDLRELRAVITQLRANDEEAGQPA